MFWLHTQRSTSLSVSPYVSRCYHTRSLSLICPPFVQASASRLAAQPGQRTRGKPGPKKGSHNKRPVVLPEADNPLAAARLNVEAHRHLSEKINYRVLDDLFEETVGIVGGGGAAAGGAGGLAVGWVGGWEQELGRGERSPCVLVLLVVSVSLHHEQGETAVSLTFGPALGRPRLRT